MHNLLQHEDPVLTHAALSGAVQWGQRMAWIGMVDAPYWHTF
jgi:hypothetical protein